MPLRWPLLLLTALVMLGVGLRVWQARESLWLDELHTAWCAGGSLAEVAPRAAIGNQSPVFFWLEWLLVQVFGASELTLRLPSLLAGSLLPAALFGLAWRWTRSSLVALVAAALVVVDPRSIFYATEARPYALVELLAVVHIGIFAELIARPTIRLRVAFVLGAALLFHLHYTAALLIPAEIACWLLAALIDRQTVRYRFWSLAVDLLCLAALAAPAAWNVAAIAGRRENWEAFVEQKPAYEMLTLLPWTAAVMFVLADALLRSAMSVKRGDAATPDGFVSGSESNPMSGFRLLLVATWLLLPVAIAWVLTATDVARIFFPRYLVASAPAAILLAALCVRLPPWPHARISLGLAIVALGIWSSAIIPQLGYDGRVIAYRRDDWRSAVAWLNERLPEEHQPVLVRSGLIEADELRGPHDPLLEDYCLLPVTSLYRLQAERADLRPLPYHDAGNLEPEVRQLVRSRGGARLVVRGSEALAQAVARRAIQSVGGRRSKVESQAEQWLVANQESFGTVHILLLRRK